MSELRLLRLREVEAKVALRKSKIYELARAGEFPRPIPLTKHPTGRRGSVAWNLADVDAWIASRIAAATRS